ncbi:hypothetical protein [Methylobacterium nodulans]|uniref:Uncharacterized protein n=1 Tax=Methylobacterium nodulans (strain LMG 21967 / CNCM I-2342 / ORS 2060) TaxID=460265 RepID=B8IY10_METNO|nr:hypothetical protein [Methylobacterium nodulans]ACL63300.1 hypothetical protein Mnod_7707 [Methylobacterium nodulans ORS 2060]
MPTKRHGNSNVRRATVPGDGGRERVAAQFRADLRRKLAEQGVSEHELDAQVNELMTRDVRFALDVEAALNAKD